MIFDSPKSFPNSVVKYTKFKDFELRYLFSYLRESEQITLEDIARLGGDGRLEEVREKIESMVNRPDLLLIRKVIELLATQRILIWMCHNVTGSAEERAHRRRGFGSEEHRRMSKVEHEWDEQKFGKLLERFIDERKRK